MAKQNKEIKEKPIELTLFEAANKLRGSVDVAEYKHVVLGLVFLKFASDKFEEHREKLISEGKIVFLLVFTASAFLFARVIQASS